MYINMHVHMLRHMHACMNTCTLTCTALMARAPCPLLHLTITPLQLLEAGGLERLLADPLKLKEAVVFAAATGALTCTAPGAIAAQPSLEAVQALFDESKRWYNFWGEATNA
jgi:hypothetical protein